MEYDGRLTLYKHRITGAEFLAYVPEHHSDGLSGSGSGGYDPKPDKVFGVAFRTKPESSTGVPHILERKFFMLLLCCCVFAIHYFDTHTYIEYASLFCQLMQ